MANGDDPRPRAETFSALSGLYDRYFTVVPANTPALLDAAHALRYQVYCVEHAFEDPAQQIGERERDRYDEGAVHAVLIYNPTEQVVGCVRLILPRAIGGISSLPLRKLLNKEDQAHIDQCDPARVPLPMAPPHQGLTVGRLSVVLFSSPPSTAKGSMHAGIPTPRWSKPTT